MDVRTARLRRPDAIRKAILWGLLPTLVLFLITPSVGDAQEVVTNITSTIGTGDLGTTITHTGNLYDITGGTRPGDGTGPILFHSFGDFSVGQSAGQADIANFKNTSVNGSFPDTSNIIGRVTGGTPSNIDGIIRTTDFPGANLYLINPFGIVFGPHGSFDVQGSVSFSTAQYLRLSDGVASANFYANSAYGSLILSPLFDFGFLPAAYGFLTAPDPSATITVQGSTLSVLPGQSISLVGGKVVIEGGAQLTALSGRIHLASTASPGEFAALPGESLANATTLQAVPNNPVDPASAVSFSSFGKVSLAPGSSIDVHGASTVWIKGGQLVLSVNDATLSTTESPTSPGATDAISLSRGSSILTSNAGADPTADVQLIASNVQLDASSIQSLATGDGHGGNISITDAQSVSLTNGAQIVSDTKGGGDGGNIIILTTNTGASSVTISGFDSEGTLGGVVNPFVGVAPSGVFSTASAGGNGGQISITAPTITLDSFGTLATINTGSGTLGQDGQLVPQVGGDISINATTAGFTNGASILSLTGFDFTLGPVGSGNGGNVTIHGLSGTADSKAVSVTLNGGSAITTLTFGPGDGGNVHIAADTIGLDGAGTAINTWTFGEGNGGNITSDAGIKLSMTNNATILTQTFGPGQGGEVGITADTLAMENFGNISTITSGDFGDGVGGNLFLNVRTLTLKDSSTIQSLNSNPGSGQGGNVTVQGLPGAVKNAAESVSLTGGSSLVSETSTGTAGDGGQISITATSVSLEGSGISSSTSGTGGGGDILVAVQDMELLNSATITGSTSSSDINLAPAGNITVQGLDGSESLARLITLSGGGAIQMVAPGVGHLGNIVVKAKTLSLTDGAAISAGTSIDTGTAGDLTIKAGSVGISGGSRISSQTFAVPAGPLTITADQLTMDQGFIVTSTTSLVPGGDGGDVVLTVGTVSLKNGSSIKSETSGVGKGGDIAMEVGSLTLASSQISSASTRSTVIENADKTTEVPGPAGNITINATGGFTSDASSIATSAEANHGGDISITAQNVQLSNATKIDASSNAPLEVTKLVLKMDENGNPVLDEIGQPVLDKVPVGDGNAGNIKITSASNVVMQNSSVTTEASEASGGSIKIDASDTGMIQLVNSKVSTSVRGDTNVSNGGNIMIDPQFVILQNSQIRANANAGAGGAIDIIATSAFIKDPVSNVNASSTLGISGTVNIQSPLQNIGEELTALTEEFSSAAALLAQQCAARAADGKFSTFVIAAREGLPAEPGGFLASPSLSADLLESRLSGLNPHTQLSAVTGLFQKYDPRPIQLAKLGNGCHR